MADSNGVLDKSSTRIQWMWMSNAAPLSAFQPAEWFPYSDIENTIIETAYNAGKTYAMLDDYEIDFKCSVQISNKDENERHSIKRCIQNKNDHRIREERFTYIPISPKRPFGDLYGWISPFIKETARQRNISRYQLPSKNEAIVPMLVELAALGIIKEGLELGKARQATQIAQILMNKQASGSREVWKCCANLYTKESFLYKRINEIMRLIGSKKHENIWRNKLETLGPFCLLLWDNPFSNKTTERGTILYRGAKLDKKQLTAFRKECSKKDKPQHSFQSFLSCSRNRSVAEMFGNVLFIMTVKHAFSVDLQPYSAYNNEEEELLFPGVCFTIDRVEQTDDKHVVYLNLIQQYNSKLIE